MRNQRLGRHAAVDRPLRRGRHHHRALAGPAGVARAAGDADPQLGGHDVQLLGAQFADRVQRAAAAGAVAPLDVDQNLVARQMLRQGAVVAPGRCRTTAALLGLRRLLPGLVLGDALLEILEPELQLVRAELLRPAAELLPQQALDQQPQLVVLGLQRAVIMRRGVLLQLFGAVSAR